EREGWGSPNVWMGHAGMTGPFGYQHAETLARGGVGQAGVATEPFNAWIDDWSLRAWGDGLNQLDMQANGADSSYRLRLTSDGPLVMHGDQGYSEKSRQGQASYYYSQPFYRVNGEVDYQGKRYRVNGLAWLDREWSSQPLSAEQEGWDWFSLHLDSGNKLMLFQVRQKDGEHYRAGSLISRDGSVQTLRGDQIQLVELDRTRQTHGREVPTRWQVQVLDHGID